MSADKPNPNLWKDWPSCRSFTFIGVTLVLLYIFLHGIFPGQESKELNKFEKNSINLMISHARVACDEYKRESAKVDSNGQLSIPKYDCLALPQYNDDLQNRIINFVSSTNTFNRECKTEVSIKGVDRVNCVSADSLKFITVLQLFARSNYPQGFLDGYKLKVHSYFWLTEDLVFLEIIFWSLFGVLASVFYNVSEALRERKDELRMYNPSIDYVNWAKLFYGPLTTIVIYFSVQVATTDNVEASFNNLRYGLIILSFVLGFFSGRTVEFLERIKNLILPLNRGGEDQVGGANVSSTPSDPLVIDGIVTFAPDVNPQPIADIANTNISLASGAKNILDNIHPDQSGRFKLSIPNSGKYLLRANLRVKDEGFLFAQEIEAKKGMEQVKVVLAYIPD